MGGPINTRTPGGRKRDRRTVARLNAERRARGASARAKAAQTLAERRLGYLVPMNRMHVAGLSLNAMAREFEAAGTPTLRGSRWWEPTTVRNLLGYFAPLFAWRESGRLDDPESRRHYVSHVAQRLGGVPVSAWVETAYDAGTSDLRSLPLLPTAEGAAWVLSELNRAGCSSWLAVEGEHSPQAAFAKIRALPPRYVVPPEDVSATLRECYEWRAPVGGFDPNGGPWWLRAARIGADGTFDP